MFKKLRALNDTDLYDICRGLIVLEELKWTGRESALWRYDEENKCIVVSEHMLMHLIQVANPGQVSRDIRVEKVCQFD